MAEQDSAAIRSNAVMRRHKRAIRGVALLTQWVKPFNTVKAYVFKAINTVHSGQLRNLGSYTITTPSTLTEDMALHFYTPPASVCILRLSAIGDTCHALPVVRTLQRTWPDTHFSWVIGKTEAALMGDVPSVEFLVFDKSRGVRAQLDLRRELRGRRYDVLLAMHASLRANIASRMIPATIRVGFDQARAKDYQWLFTNHQIPARPAQHVMDGLFEFAEYLGIEERLVRWDIPLSEADRVFAASQVPDDVPVLVISPCGSQRFRNFRNWSIDNYAAVADHYADRYASAVVLTGGPTDLEQEYGTAIAAKTRCQPNNLIGKTSLKQLLAVLARATVLVCPDSGPAHMATTVGTPVVGLYATSNPNRTGPYFSRQWVVNKYPEAVMAEFGRTVGQMPWGGRVRNPRAMELIRVDEVTTMLDRVMAETTALS
jgi:heptosyltransferase I